MQVIDQKIIQTIAEKAYENKTFPDGASVYSHCIELSNVFARHKCYELAGVALLHEVFNCSELKEADLREMCLLKPVLDGILALQQLENESWITYISRLKSDAACGYVKLLDVLIHAQMPHTKKEEHENRFALMILAGWPVETLKFDKFYDLIETPKELRKYHTK